MQARRSVLVLVLALAVLLTAGSFFAQSPAPYTLVSPEGRQPLGVGVIGGQEVFSLDELASIFQLAIREDALAGGITVSHKGKLIVLTADQGVASVDGRLINLPSPPVREGRRWLVPVDFVSAAIAPIYDRRIAVRKSSRLIVLGDIRAPRVVAKHEWLGSAARVTFEISPKVAHTLAQEGTQLVLTLESDLIDAVLPPSVVSQGVVTAIRVADPRGIVSIDLGPRFGSFRSSIGASEGTDVLRLVIDLLPSDASTTIASPPETTPVEQVPPLVSPSHVVDAIAIDPGHGGSEAGAVGRGGHQEKDIALAVAYRLKAAIEGRLGIRVILTRDADETVGLDERAERANHNKADLFISLHANASMRPDIKGVAVLYLGSQEYGDQTGGVASHPSVLPSVSGLPRNLEVIPWETAQVRYIDQSRSFAVILEEELRGRFAMSGRPLQPAPLRVLLGANMPAVLVELGFMSNPVEEKLLGSEEHQQRLAQALFDAMSRFRQQLEAEAQAVPTSRAPNTR